MRVAIVRHGKAEPGSVSGMDFDRDLRPRGVRQAEYLRDRLFELMPRGAVVSSRAVRARRTAEIIACGRGVEVAYDDRLLVDEPVSGVLGLIAEHGGEEGLVLVGHNPQCERLIGVLISGPGGMLNERVRTGEAVVLDVDPADAVGRGAIVRRLRLSASSV